MDVPEPVVESPAAVLHDDDDDPAPWRDSDTDTASLLRELSSLGLDDDAPQPVLRAAGPVRPVSAEPAKKRKGLFGRG